MSKVDSTCLPRDPRLMWLMRSKKRWGMLHMRLSRPVCPFTSRAFRYVSLITAFFSFLDVHRFDAHAIPLEGPYGLIAAASRLLDTAGTLDERGKKALLARFIRFVQENQ